MAYQFEEPFILDTSKYQAAFGAAGTPLAKAVAATIAWYPILVATMSGPALAVTTGIAAGVLLLGTAAAGFHDLAGVRPGRRPARPRRDRRPSDRRAGGSSCGTDPICAP